jgi:hypothetical protein
MEEGPPKPNQNRIISTEATIALVVTIFNLALDQADKHIRIISWISVLACIVLCVDLFRRTSWATHPRYGMRRLWVGSGLICMAFLAFGIFLSLHKKELADTSTGAKAPPPETLSPKSEPPVVIPPPSEPAAKPVDKASAKPKEVDHAATKSTEPPKALQVAPPGTVTTGPVTTGPCPVIQIGGSNNQAIGGSCEPPSRHISKERHDELKMIFSRSRERAIVWFFGSDSDTQILAQDIYDVLHDSGWEMESPTPVASIQTEPFACDIAVFLPGPMGTPPTEAARAVLTALQSPRMQLEVKQSWSDRVPNGSVKLVIGSRWLKP